MPSRSKERRQSSQPHQSQNQHPSSPASSYTVSQSVAHPNHIPPPPSPPQLSMPPTNLKNSAPTTNSSASGTIPTTAVNDHYHHHHHNQHAENNHINSHSHHNAAATKHHHQHSAGSARDAPVTMPRRSLLPRALTSLAASALNCRREASPSSLPSTSRKRHTSNFSHAQETAGVNHESEPTNAQGRCNIPPKARGFNDPSAANDGPETPPGLRAHPYPEDQMQQLREKAPRIVREHYDISTYMAYASGFVEAKCLHCPAHIKAQRNVTSNFIQHTKRRHAEKYRGFENRRRRRTTSQEVQFPELPVTMDCESQRRQGNQQMTLVQHDMENAEDSQPRTKRARESRHCASGNNRVGYPQNVRGRASSFSYGREPPQSSQAHPPSQNAIDHREYYQGSLPGPSREVPIHGGYRSHSQHVDGMVIPMTSLHEFHQNHLQQQRQNVGHTNYQLASSYGYPQSPYVNQSSRGGNTANTQDSASTHHPTPSHQGQAVAINSNNQLYAAVNRQGGFNPQVLTSVQNAAAQSPSPATQLNEPISICVPTSTTRTCDPGNMTNIIELIITSASRRDSKVKKTPCPDVTNALFGPHQLDKLKGINIFIKREDLQVGGLLNVRGAYSGLKKKQDKSEIPAAGIFTPSKTIFEAAVLADVRCVAFVGKQRGGLRMAKKMNMNCTSKIARPQRLFTSLSEMEDSFGKVETYQDGPAARTNGERSTDSESGRRELTYRSLDKACKRLGGLWVSGDHEMILEHDSAAGFGTLALEIIDQVPKLNAIIMPVGPALFPVAAAFHRLAPHCGIIAVTNPSQSSQFSSWKQRLVSINQHGNYNNITLVDVTPQEMKKGMEDAYFASRALVEPVGACAMAALAKYIFSAECSRRLKKLQLTGIVVVIEKPVPYLEKLKEILRTDFEGVDSEVEATHPEQHTHAQYPPTHNPPAQHPVPHLASQAIPQPTSQPAPLTGSHPGESAIATEAGQGPVVWNQCEEVAQGQGGIQKQDWRVLIRPSSSSQTNAHTNSRCMILNIFNLILGNGQLPFPLRSIDFRGTWPFSLSVHSDGMEGIRRYFEQHVSNAGFVVNIEPQGGLQTKVQDFESTGDDEFSLPPAPGNNTDLAWRVNTIPPYNNAAAVLAILGQHIRGDGVSLLSVFFKHTPTNTRDEFTFTIRVRHLAMAAQIEFGLRHDARVKRMFAMSPKTSGLPARVSVPPTPMPSTPVSPTPVSPDLVSPTHAPIPTSTHVMAANATQGNLPVQVKSGRKNMEMVGNIDIGNEEETRGEEPEGKGEEGRELIVSAKSQGGAGTGTGADKENEASNALVTMGLAGPVPREGGRGDAREPREGDKGGVEDDQSAEFANSQRQDNDAAHHSRAKQVSSPKMAEETAVEMNERAPQAESPGLVSGHDGEERNLNGGGDEKGKEQDACDGETGGANGAEAAGKA